MADANIKWAICQYHGEHPVNYFATMYNIVTRSYSAAHTTNEKIYCWHEYTEEWLTDAPIKAFPASCLRCKMEYSLILRALDLGE